ncbi:glucosamine-6-phosphate deaminase [Chitinophaga sancti]|uniref:Glucosamine-6-phosphate deaminase n=1 Tax=Chitinophaga sancti TaxID=1004 RepID=A0A1K1QJW1_9BACT|nr:glucosamine-6-phosphate deaminase [Chitinophaga sancti]WQD65211.1 glucosamine-6-phosphate deaminase [Chitinophaga sancti]WQG89165.1 glucosamine-6-phosphate deaminase [Chitinophaga sancti]SFW59923.1 glucosamine-6-phosphate deaminase [Chitinophaga sancti]
MTLNHQEIELIDSFEQIAVDIYPTAKDGSKAVAQEIAALIKARQATNKNVVLGLATGSTPKYLYAELVRLHREEGLSFKNVITFNLDEYYPIEPDALQSYNRFMKEQLFNHIDIPEENTHVPDGTIPKEKVKEFAAEYEAKIEAAGGIDLQILGIGTNGHIGFNEPGSALTSHTRLVTLDNSTRMANAFEFSNMSLVPRLAITMGLNTIFKAKRVVLLAWGSHKSKIVQRSVEGHSSDQVPASLLQQHSDCKFVIDEQAAEDLTRNKEPWLTGDCEWTPKLRRKAVTNLALKLNKPILMLTDRDYNENGLNDLIVQYGSAYELNIEEFNGLRDTITGWPGGKPGTQLPSHPERSEPLKKRVLIFSPHPDDDIISMGGTFIRLHEQGHDVHVGYQTSGNIAVTDEFVLRYIDFAVGFEDMFGIDRSKSSQVLADAKAFLGSKKPSQKDSPEIRAIKGLIRRGEAKATCRYVGIPEENIHYNNLPFYETGLIEKAPASQADIDITKDLIRKIKPHQIFCAGDLADPHGTHKVCLEIIFAALDQLKHEEFMKECWVWLYKGAWQEWKINEIEMAVPMSPDQVRQKRLGIFIHQSQKDVVPFQGTDSREFWERAEDRNADTANLYDQLGLQKYAAMEAFVRYHFM